MEQLFFNGTILTMEGEGDQAEAVLTEGGRIKKAGNYRELMSLAGEGARYIDLKGKTMLPAFVDGHSHISMTAQMSVAADLSGKESFEGIVAALKEQRKENKITKDGLILGFGYDHNFLPGLKHPGKEYLNQVAEDIPVVALHASGHMGCVNDVVLKLAGITRDTKDPAGGIIGREEGTGEPNGYLEESAMLSVQKLLAPRIRFDVKEAIQKAQQIYLEHGITTVQDGASTKETVELLHQAAAMKLLHVDVVAYPLIDEEAQQIFSEYPDCANRYQNHVKLGGYKIVLDGSPQGKSAWLTKPYEGSNGYCGYQRYQDEAVEKLVQQAVDQGHQMLAHCNGDAAGDQFLRCYEKALKNSKNQKKDLLRPVMIHCQTVRRDQLDKMKELSMIPSVFVGHVYYWGDVHLKNLGQERGSHISPCESAFQKGLKVNFHQDAPVTKPDMLHSVWCAVNRLTREGRQLAREEKCSVYEALEAVTINAAYAYFEEAQKGSIREGKLADFVILDKNPMETEPMQLKDIRVLETIKEGECVYLAGGRQDL